MCGYCEVRGSNSHAGYRGIDNLNVFGQRFTVGDHVLHAAPEGVLHMGQRLFLGIAPSAAAAKRGDNGIPAPIFVLSQIYLEDVRFHVQQLP